MLAIGIGYSDSILNVCIHSKIRKKRIVAFLIDETQIQIGSTEQAWPWVAIEPLHRRILGVYITYQDMGIF